MQKIYSYAIIGAGLIGSAAAKYIATNNNNVILIGPKEPENKLDHNGIFASHYDEGRITRISDSDTTWAYLAKKSILNYNSIFNLSKIDFYKEVGQVSVGPKSNNVDSYINSIIESSKKITYDYFHLNIEKINSRYSNLKFPENSDFILQTNNAGHISPRRLVKAQIKIFTILKGTYLPSVVNNIEITDSSNFIILTYNELIDDLKGSIERCFQLSNQTINDKFRESINQKIRQSYVKKHQNKTVIDFGFKEEKIRNDFDFIYKKYFNKI